MDKDADGSVVGLLIAPDEEKIAVQISGTKLIAGNLYCTEQLASEPIKIRRNVQILRKQRVKYHAVGHASGGNDNGNKGFGFRLGLHG